MSGDGSTGRPTGWADWLRSGMPRRGWLKLLDPALEAKRWGLPEMVVLLLWCGVAGFAVAQHVPWADEEQAWLLAGGEGWRQLFAVSLHYEGSGGLWHAFLKVLQAAGVPFTAMRWIVAGIQGAAMAVLLRYAPFPRVVRLVLPFTFFLLYQDGVIARSYCLFAILAFPAAAMLRGRRPKLMVMAVLAGLLANLSVHGMVLSGGLAVAAFSVSRRQGAGRERAGRGLAALAVLLLLWTAAAVTMAPAFHIDYEPGNNLRRSFAKFENRFGIATPPPPVIRTLPMAGLQPAPVVPRSKGRGLQRLGKLAHTLAVLTYPLSQWRALALFLVLGVGGLARLDPEHREDEGREAGGALGWAGLAPYGLMVAVFTGLYLAPRHAGTVLTGFVVSAWLVWPRSTPQEGWPRVWTRATAALFALVCLLQVGWTLHAVAAERRLPYAPGRMTASYLRSQGVPEGGGGLPAMAGYYYFSMDPLLYFRRNLYENQPPHRYWWWSTAMRTMSSAEQVLASRPRFVVVGGYEYGPDAEVTGDWQPVSTPIPGVLLNDNFHVVDFFERNGYRRTHVFCGHSWMRATYAELLCDTVLEPTSARSADVSLPASQQTPRVAPAREETYTPHGSR